MFKKFFNWIDSYITIKKEANKIAIAAYKIHVYHKGIDTLPGFITINKIDNAVRYFIHIIQALAIVYLMIKVFAFA